MAVFKPLPVEERLSQPNQVAIYRSLGGPLYKRPTDLAAERGDVAEGKLLLESGANPNDGSAGNMFELDKSYMIREKQEIGEFLRKARTNYSK